MHTDIDLDVEVRKGLETRRGTWVEIAEQSKVSHSWISQFMRGKIGNPGIETLKAIRATWAAKSANTDEAKAGS